MSKTARRLLEVCLAVYVVGVLGLAAAAKAAPAAGYGLYAVRSASMAPAIGVGALVVAQQVDPAAIQPGDVITVAARTGATVTHRVVAVSSGAGGPAFTTRGDANASPDPVATPAADVRGRVAWEIPLLGFFLAMVTMPSGVVALLSIGATLLTGVWMLDDLEAADDEEELEQLAHKLGPGQAVLR
jgi:signal peptidase I